MLDTKTVCFAAALIVSTGLRVGATTITLDTSTNPFPGADSNQGWWSTTAANINGNTNYYTGFGGGEHRSFFTFDLSGVDFTGQMLVSATLRLARSSYYDGGGYLPSQTVGFFDVTTDAATLNDNTGTNASIFADLGSGVSYGSFVVAQYPGYPGDSMPIDFDLNANALQDILAAGGGVFSVGGALLQGPGALFSSSGSAGDQLLILETTAVPVPEPASLMLLGTGAAAVLARRARRGQRP